MADVALWWQAFHFLRPWWLLAIVLIVLLWWRVRRAGKGRGLESTALAPHLQEALTIGSRGTRRWLPVDGVALVLLLFSVGAAGPTWSRLADPFMAQSAPAVIILKVTPSMDERDVAPSRLQRARQKISDLLDLRAGGRTALIAYAGSAHRVLPMTEDPAVMAPYLKGLDFDVMPVSGNRAVPALALAQSVLAQEELPGGMLLLTDSVDPADVAALNETAETLTVLAVLPADQADPGLDRLTVNVVTLSANKTDIREIDRRLNTAYRRAMLENSNQPWEDRGHWLAWPAALLTLLCFRRGWTMHWAPMLLLLGLFSIPQTSRADGIADWFLTPDQQGQLAFNDRQYRRAARLYADPLHRGYALFLDGQYEQGVEVLDRVETAQAAFIQGVAHLRSRGYRDGVRAFELALKRDPQYPGAAENLALARRIVAYVEETREQSDTGEDGGIGADDVVFDNEADRGADTRMEVPGKNKGKELLSTEQWMNTVDTSTGDFLRQRFALEAAQQQ